MLIANAEWLPQDIGLLLFFALEGLIAGSIRSAQKINPRPMLRDVIIQGLGGSFVAFLFGAGCLYYWGAEKNLLSIIVAGVGAWGGTMYLDKFNGALNQRVDQTLPKIDPPKGTP